jgi:DNA-binding NarL/FixJ family response regulator
VSCGTPFAQRVFRRVTFADPALFLTSNQGQPDLSFETRSHLEASGMDTGSHDSIIPEVELRPPPADDSVARREALAGSRTPVVLIVDTTAHRLAAIRAWSWQHRGIRPVVASSATTAYEAASREQPEVALVNLMFRGGRGIAVAVELRRVAPGIELVFVVEDPTVPEVQAAKDLGWERLVAAASLEDWLNRGLKPLAKLAKLKRQVAAAQREVETLSAGNVVPAVPSLSLDAAERRYRETFLRSTMATAGGRRAAARLAGVPYTTFCVMLRKLGIKH